MNFFFIIDEYTDDADGVEAHTYADMVENVFENPHVEHPQGESVIGEITRQYVPFSVRLSSASFNQMICIRRFWIRAMKSASKGAQRRFIRYFTNYVYGVTDEGFDRTNGHIRNLDDFMPLRRLTSDSRATFLSIELGLDIPDEVYEHPLLESLLDLTADTIVITMCLSLPPNA